MSLYQTIFIKLLSEEMSAASTFTGCIPIAGRTGGSVGNSDSYANGDARIPMFLGSKKKRIKKKKKKKKSKWKVPGEQFPVMQTRMSGMSGPGNKPSVGSLGGFGSI